jgi:transcriptional regulator with XRE-family HTH domain
MTSKKKQTTALALTGAVALASGAYALGSQSDGDAAAAGEDRGERPALMHRGGPGRGFGLERLADRLGVEASELREALEDVRGTVDPPADRRDAFAKELAAELNTTQAKVEAALERIREKHEAEFEKRHDAMAEALAKRLNLDAAKVKEALEAPRLFRRP